MISIVTNKLTYITWKLWAYAIAFAIIKLNNTVRICGWNIILGIFHYFCIQSVIHITDSKAYL